MPPKTIEKSITVKELISKFELLSNHTTKCVLKKIKCHILEMEDVLFHLNSAVIMPENPEGPSSKQGKATDEQKLATGVRALALVFRQLQENPKQKVLICGHTDKSGDVSDNFKLSEYRAQNALYLLTEKRSEWADICEKKQRIEDYQQIMSNYAKAFNWNCDPGSIDNTWGPKTENATNNFITLYNYSYAYKNTPTSSINEAIIDRIKRDPEKKWPKEMWEAVFDLYNHDLVLAATGKNIPDNAFKTLRKSIKFIDENKPYVACASSLPKDRRKKVSYRSQKDRRVEILFFDEKEAPTLTCPERTDSVHTEKECPFGDEQLFKFVNIDPEKYFTATYHLKFEYYDRIKKSIVAVPDGLSIKAWKEGTKSLNASTKYENGIYCIEVEGITNSPREDDIHFSFEFPNGWIHTKDDSAEPFIVSKLSDVDPNSPDTPITPLEIAQMDVYNQVKFYDLPEKWDSRNWLCQYSDSYGLTKEHILELTQTGNPLRFNLDCIVLANSSLQQKLNDKDGYGKAKDLKKDMSRFRVVYIDPDIGCLKLYEAVSGDSLFDSIVKFPKDPNIPSANLIQDPTKFRFFNDSNDKPLNFIIAPPVHVRAILFCGEFYDVMNKRSIEKDVKIEKGEILGARIAILNDPDYHIHEYMHAGQTKEFIHYPNIGDFDLHYLHGGGCDGSNIFSYLIVYWSAFITMDTNPKIGGTGDETPPKTAEVSEFKTVGMKNCMEHWNKKGYQFEVNSGGDSDILIKPFFLFEAFENFAYNPPTSIDFTDDDYNVLFKRTDFKNAIKNAYGGKPKTVAFITCEQKGSWFLSGHSNVRPFSISDLAINDRMDNLNYFPAYFPYGEFGDPGGNNSYGCLAMAHEIGHAIGQVDDYLDKNCLVNNNGNWEDISVPTYQQWGYDNTYKEIELNKSNFQQRVAGSDPWEILHDKIPMMCYMGPIRMRYVWRYVYWINKQSQDANVKMSSFLDGRQFNIKYPRANLEYFRSPSSVIDPYAFSHKATISISDGSEADVITTNDKTINVYLYNNIDETQVINRSKWIPPKTDMKIKAILVIRVLITIEFVPDNSSGTAINWTGVEKEDWVEDIETIFFNSSHAGQRGKQEGKYYLTDNTGKKVDPTLIHLLPGFEFDTDQKIVEVSNYHIRVIKNSNSAITRNNKIITLGQLIPGIELFNFFFGKPAADSTFSLTPTNNFSFLETWFQNKFGNGFKVKEL